MSLIPRRMTNSVVQDSTCIVTMASTLLDCFICRSVAAGNSEIERAKIKNPTFSILQLKVTNGKRFNNFLLLLVCIANQIGNPTRYWKPLLSTAVWLKFSEILVLYRGNIFLTSLQRRGISDPV